MVLKGFAVKLNVPILCCQIYLVQGNKYYRQHRTNIQLKRSINVNHAHATILLFPFTVPHHEELARNALCNGVMSKPAWLHTVTNGRFEKIDTFIVFIFFKRVDVFFLFLTLLYSPGLAQVTWALNAAWLSFKARYMSFLIETCVLKFNMSVLMCL